jgi:hypothetical protein
LEHKTNRWRSLTGRLQKNKKVPYPQLTTTQEVLAKKVVRMVKHHHHTTNFCFYIFEIKDLDSGKKKKGGARCNVRERGDLLLLVYG